MVPRMQVPAAHSAANSADVDECQLTGLLRAIAGRDAEALGRFYDLTLGRVYGLILRVVRNPADAEEVAGDLYLQVWEKAPEYRAERGSVLAWLKTLAWSRAVDRQRRDRRRGMETPLHPEGDEDAYTQCEGLTVEQAAEAWSSERAIQAAFAALTDVQKQVLTLAFHEDMSHQDIAEHTRLPLGTVKSHARRGLACLRQALLAKGFAHD
jgi:RNA polymerase sigma-70 factor (ECF subfamily)